MTTDMSTRTAALVVAAVLLGAGATACGGGDQADGTTAGATSSSVTAAPSSSAAPTSSAQASGPDYTVADYLRDNGITQTPVTRGEPGAPQLDLPIPPGWQDVGADTPPDAWAAIVLADPAATDPPAIIARMARLSGGDPDSVKILELAPNAVRSQPGYQGPDTGRPSQLGGRDAVEIAGTVVQDGQPSFVARKTVVIPGRDAMYLLALDAQGTEDQQAALTDAMSVIDAETTIEP